MLPVLPPTPHHRPSHPAVWLLLPVTAALLVPLIPLLGLLLLLTVGIGHGLPRSPQLACTTETALNLLDLERRLLAPLVAGRALHFHWTGDGQHLIYYDGSDATTYQYTPGTRTRANLTVTPGIPLRAQWSRDGWQAMYFADADDQTRLTITDLRTRQTTRLDLGQRLLSPVWSPDASQLAVYLRDTTAADTDTWQLVVVNRADGVRQPVTMPESFPVLRFKAPVWTPDQTGLVMTFGRQDYWATYRFPVTNDPAATVPPEPQELFRSGRRRVIAEAGESWSPDGQQVLTHFIDDLIYYSQYQLLDLRDQSVTSILCATCNPVDTSFPVWSADGRYLFFIMELTDTRVIRRRDLLTDTLTEIYAAPELVLSQLLALRP